MIGGYQIIDLKDIPLTQSGVSIPGAYELIANTRKPLLVQNISIKGDDNVITKYNDIFATAKKTSGGYRVSDFSQEISLIFQSSGGDVHGRKAIGIDPAYIYINNTLEVDANGDLGVASN